MLARIAILSIVLTLSACGEIRTVTSPSEVIFGSMGGIPIRVVAHDEPEIYFASVVRALNPVMLPPGEVPKDDVKSLAYASHLLAGKLSSSLAQKYGISFKSEIVQAPYLEIRPLDRNPPIALTLEIDFEFHSLIYRPLKWATYQYMISASARLVDANGKTVWLQHCLVGGSDPDKFLQVTHEKLFGEDMTRFREVRELAVARCAEQMVSVVSGET